MFEIFRIFTIIVCIYFVVFLLQGQSAEFAIERIKQLFWMILKMNWKVWTIFTYINVNYIPIKVREPMCQIRDGMG